MMRDTLTKEQLFSLRAGVPGKDIYNEIKKSWDHLSKPIDGLGEFEDVICKIGAIQGKKDVSLSSRKAVIFCADNGIIEEGVSQTGKEVTLQVARMLGRGESTANTLGRSVRCDVIPVDIGIDDKDSNFTDGDAVRPEENRRESGIPGVRSLKVSSGTRNFLKEDAMTEEGVLRAIGTGIDIAKELKDGGTDIIITGEMGIGNTTTASALMCLLTGAEPSDIVGRGAGLDNEGLLRKVEVVKKAVSKFREPVTKDGNKPVEYAPKAHLAGGIFFEEDAPWRKELALSALSAVGGLDTKFRWS